jgi:2-succinyl-6-hydroxy-2,4-cyclohexadiene-1-carboxylate synthase
MITADFPWHLHVADFVTDSSDSNSEFNPYVVATSNPTIVVLHGFTGSGKIHFDLLLRGFRQSAALTRFRLVAPDLPGHGETPLANSETHYTLDSQLHTLHRLITKLQANASAATSTPPKSYISPSPIHLIGYSMGSRLALAYALKHPENIRSLTLESCNTGISSPSDRHARSQRDAQLAITLLNNYPAFLQSWNRLPLFASPQSAPAEPTASFSRIQQQQRPEGLAASLQHFSTGLSPDFSEDLRKLNMPVLALTGVLDVQYSHKWQTIASKYPNIRHISLPHAGHRVHLDQPDAYIEHIRMFVCENL